MQQNYGLFTVSIFFIIQFNIVEFNLQHKDVKQRLPLGNYFRP